MQTPEQNFTTPIKARVELDTTPELAIVRDVDPNKEAMDRIFQRLQITRSSADIHTSNQSLTLIFNASVPLGAYRAFHDRSRYEEYKDITEKLQKEAPTSIPTGITFDDTRKCVFTPILKPILLDDRDSEEKKQELKKELTQALTTLWDANFVHGDVTKWINSLDGRRLVVHLGNFMSEDGKYVLIDYETTRKTEAGDIEEEKQKWEQAEIYVGGIKELQLERGLLVGSPPSTPYQNDF
jgi:hypothetical protein